LSAPPVRSRLALWAVLLTGFSPVIVRFLRVEAASAPPSTLVAPVLIAIALWRGSAPAEPPRRAGVALVAVGLVLELFGTAMDVWTVAWLGLPVAVIGMSLWLGAPSWRVAVLALGLVPIPESIRGAWTPAPESALLAGACAAWRAVGVAFSCTGPVARLGDRHLELFHDDVGFGLAPLLAQLGWFLAVDRGASAARALRAAALSAAAVVVLAPLAIAFALGIFAASSPVVARVWLSPGLWVACCAVALASIAGTQRGARKWRGTILDR